MKKKRKSHKAKPPYDFKTNSTHPHICASCGDKLTKCACKHSYIFAYKCRKCAGLKPVEPTDLEQIEENLDLGVIKSVLGRSTG